MCAFFSFFLFLLQILTRVRFSFLSFLIVPFLSFSFVLFFVFCFFFSLSFSSVFKVREEVHIVHCKIIGVLNISTAVSQVTFLWKTT